MIFCPGLPSKKSDIAAIKAEIANRRVDLAGRVRQTIARLEKASSDASALRSNPGSEAIDAWTAWKSVDQFERELQPSGREAVQLLGVAAICLAGVWISAGLQHSPIVLTEPRVQGKATDFVPRQIPGDHETGLPLPTPHESITDSGFGSCIWHSALVSAARLSKSIRSRRYLAPSLPKAKKSLRSS